LCVGQATIDLVFSLERHPGPDEKTVARGLQWHGGGPAANAAVAAVRLGGRAGFAGFLGRGPLGDLLHRELRSEGVDLSLASRGEGKNAISAILVKPDGRRTVVNYRAGESRLAQGAIDLAPPLPRVLLLDGLEPEISPSLARQARERGIPVVLDAGSVHAGTRALADRVDVLACSAAFAREYTGAPDAAEALPVLAALAPAVVITLGSRGALWQREGIRGQTPAFPVSAVDTTGAGDAFHGALALALAEQMGWEEALRFASAAGALTCTRLGARTALPTREAVQRLLRSSDG
jgi:sulfofructose kinase